MEELEPHRRQSDRPRGRLRKGMYILPSLFTTANIAAGFYAILQTVHAVSGETWHLDFAAKAIGFAVLFDGLDGRIARMTNTASDFRQGTRFARRRDHLRRCPGAARLDVGLSFVADDHCARPAPEDYGTGLRRLLRFPHGGREPAGSLQHREESRAFESGTSGKEVFRGHADSGRRGSDCGHRPLLRRRARDFLVDCDQLVADGRRGRISDGQHLAFLQLQGY